MVGKRLRDEAGFSLPELMVAIFVGGILFAAGLVFVVVTSRQSAAQQDRVSQTDDARNALSAMTSELRDATSVQLVNERSTAHWRTFVSPARLSILVSRNAPERRGEPTPRSSSGTSSTRTISRSSRVPI
jgi:prepilin-type N-terminal cleavage/methylation domain-containing protein